MIPLETQEQFENMLKTTVLNPEAVVVYFTAPWCGACSRLDWTRILAETNQKIVWYKCDIDVNKYTLGYCFPPNQRKIPAFVLIKNSELVQKFNVSDTDLVIEVMNEVFN